MVVAAWPRLYTGGGAKNANRKDRKCKRKKCKKLQKMQLTRQNGRPSKKTLRSKRGLFPFGAVCQAPCRMKCNHTAKNAKWPKMRLHMTSSTKFVNPQSHSHEKRDILLSKLEARGWKSEGEERKRKLKKRKTFLQRRLGSFFSRHKMQEVLPEKAENAKNATYKGKKPLHEKKIQKIQKKMQNGPKCKKLAIWAWFVERVTSTTHSIALTSPMASFPANDLTRHKTESKSPVLCSPASNLACVLSLAPGLYPQPSTRLVPSALHQACALSLAPGLCPQPCTSLTRTTLIVQTGQAQRTWYKSTLHN